MFSFCVWIAFIIANKFNFSMQTTHYDTWSPHRLTFNALCTVLASTSCFVDSSVDLFLLLSNSASLFGIFNKALMTVSIDKKRKSYLNRCKILIYVSMLPRTANLRHQLYCQLYIFYQYWGRTVAIPRILQIFCHFLCFAKVWVNEIFRMLHSLRIHVLIQDFTAAITTTTTIIIV